MNFALSDEQEFLQEAARGALARFRTVEAAREAADGAALPDLWPTACEAGWPGLMVSEAGGGAELGAIDAMLVFAELGRVLAAVPLLGHVPASRVLDRGRADAGVVAAVASGEERAALVPARPPSDVDATWTVEPAEGLQRAGAPVLEDGRVTGVVHWVPDAPGAEHLVVVLADGGAAHVRAADAGVEPVVRFDATRSLGHVRLEGAPATRLALEADEAATAWHLAQALLGAEALGATEAALATSVAYAKERFTFGRAIGSYQAVKHELVEMLRRSDNARSLMYYAGWAAQDRPAEFPLAAAAFRLAAGQALDHATRAQINVHGGIGATWEHDAPYAFRRAQLSRRLLGGDAGAADRVAGELIAAARSEKAAAVA